MIPRYQTDKMSQIFSEANKHKTWLSVELAHLEARLRYKNKLDEKLLKRLSDRAALIDWPAFAVRVEAHEAVLRHDVIAFLHGLEEELGGDARHLHYGLTSSDIVDTGLGLQVKAAGEVILGRLKDLLDSLWRQANAFKGVICLGRTHGQAAEPSTFGIKLLGHLCEFMRAHERLSLAFDDLRVGKLSGAVGVYAHTEPLVEEAALSVLGLRAETVATQVVARDRHAGLLAAFAILAGTMERLAVEIRLLMHGGIQEVFEPFTSGQKGSSAMPHKKNPILSENLTGLARLMRTYALAAFENQALWHERDISHSSVERVIIPDVMHLADFALTRLKGLMDHLVIDEEQMRENLRRAGDSLSSQTVLLLLVDKGLERQKAYELAQRAALLPKQNFKEALLALGIHQYLSEKELAQALAAGAKIPHEQLLFERVAKLRRA